MTQEHVKQDDVKAVTAPEDRQNGSSSGSVNEGLPDWVKTALETSRKDQREQPWKKAFKPDRDVESMEKVFADEPDLILVQDSKKVSQQQWGIAIESQSLGG